MSRPHLMHKKQHKDKFFYDRLILVPALCLIFFGLLMVASASLAVSVKDYGNPLSPDDADSNDSGSEIDYTSEIQPIFDLNCTFSNCHDSASPAGGLNLLTYASLMSASVIDAGNPSGSELYDRIIRAETSPGDMPPTGSLSDEQIELIETWINDGALE